MRSDEKADWCNYLPGENVDEIIDILTKNKGKK